MVAALLDCFTCYTPKHLVPASTPHHITPTTPSLPRWYPPTLTPTAPAAAPHSPAQAQCWTAPLHEPAAAQHRQGHQRPEPAGPPHARPRPAAAPPAAQSPGAAVPAPGPPRRQHACAGSLRGERSRISRLRAQLLCGRSSGMQRPRPCAQGSGRRAHVLCLRGQLGTGVGGGGGAGQQVAASPGE
jgi:hypothetical protein